MWQLEVSPIEIVVRTTIIYLLFLVSLRISGKRQLGQFTLFDIALVLLAANALQPAMTGPDQSVTGGLIIIATMFSLNQVIVQARLHIPMVRRLLEFQPTIIGRNGRWLKDELEKQGLDLDDVQAALREHGLVRVEQMKLAVLEEDGSISIIPAEGEDTPEARRRRRRYKRSSF
jgi:uncharacterized membrane protein YcaP (DUF421 family)